jgi:polar amino acid transport system substrate-binding protein
MTKRPALVAAGLALLASLAACGATPNRGGGAANYGAPMPQGVVPSVSPTGTGGGQAQNCNPRASLRPQGSLPEPGNMPGGSTMKRIADSGLLKVGVDQNTNLFGYRNPATGQIEGFDIDVAREVAKAIFGDPNRVQLIAITSAQRIPYIEQGKVDIVADTMTMNCDRWTKVNFSSVYYEAGQRVLVNKNSPVKEIKDLNGRKVCAAAGSTSINNIANLDKIIKQPVKPIAVSVPDWTDCMVLLQQGQVDAVSTDDTILAGMADQDPSTQLIGTKFTEEPYGMAISKNSPDFVRFVNGVLQRMRENGGLHAINVRWLKENAPADVPQAAYQD